MKDQRSLPRVPLHLVTGFLGSGKTTLLNALLRNPAFAGTLVIVNEFGAVGLDHLLIAESQDNVVLLDSGCLCCAASGSLRDTLIDLFARRGSGTTPKFDRIVVETSGLANPVPLVATILGDSALNTRCRLAQVLTLVDAVNGLHTLEQYPDAARQVALADRLLVTKLDLAPADVLPRLQAALVRINPRAPIEEHALGDAADRHFEAGCNTGAKSPATQGRATQAPVAAFLRGPLRAQYGITPDAAGAAGSQATHAAAFARIASHVWRVPQVLDWPTYADWSATLRNRFGARLLRCKGLLAIDSPDTPWVVQGVQGHFVAPERLPAWPADQGDGFIVCIGESIARADLESVMALLGPPFGGRTGRRLERTRTL